MCEEFKVEGRTILAWIANLGHGIAPEVDPGEP